MSSQAGYSSSFLFQSINDDLTASIATADELSKEFSSLMQEAASSKPQQSWSQTSSVIPREKPQPLSTPSMPSSSTPWTTSMPSSTSSMPTTSSRTSSGSDINSGNGGSSSMSYILSPTAQRPLDSIISSNKSVPSTPVFPSQSYTPPQVRKDLHMSSDSYTYRQMSPTNSPHMQRRESPSRYDRSPRGSLSYMEQSASPSTNPTVTTFDQAFRPGLFHPAPGLLSPYDSIQMGRRSPLADRSPSPRPVSSTLPRNFAGFMPADEGVQRQKSPGKWNETDLDVSYERKAHHTYDKKEWLRPSVPNSSWRESNLDGPPPSHNAKKDSLPRFHPPSHGSLPRNARITVPPDGAPPLLAPQPIISRISIPPVNTRPSQRRPIPLSVIMRLQNPRWAAAPMHYPGTLGNVVPYQPPVPLPREFLPQPPPPQAPPPELRQPAIYSDALNPGDIDAELEGLPQRLPAISETPGASEVGGEAPQDPTAAPRPLSPTRLQPVVAPEAQSQVIPDLEELLRVRAEIPRALKRRGSVDQSQPQKKASHYEPNQYKNLINNLFRRKGLRQKGEQGSENSSSSEGEDSPALPPPAIPPMSSTLIPQSYHSILRRSSRQHKNSGRRARLSPLVLLLDGSLVGEMDTVKRAVQEMNDPSQPNDEGITALHNAICGGHYNVVDFLVCMGANVSAPDSHGWTPLHCAASCNDRPLCEFLVRNGAAVMAVTESDGATASQKCDPYAEGFEECESFLRGVEEAMGVENSGVLYALWSYPAQAADELSFKEGDMVTILQKTEGVDWWWASLCGREGFVPNNYFGLFPKVRPKSLC